jgi:hypothetical protein
MTRNRDTERDLIEAANLLCEAAQRLPKGYLITLTADDSESSISLTNEFGDDIEPFDGEWDYSAWSGAIDAAIEHAANDLPRFSIDAQDKETDAQKGGE